MALVRLFPSRSHNHTLAWLHLRACVKVLIHYFSPAALLMDPVCRAVYHGRSIYQVPAKFLSAFSVIRWSGWSGSPGFTHAPRFNNVSSDGVTPLQQTLTVQYVYIDWHFPCACFLVEACETQFYMYNSMQPLWEQNGKTASAQLFRPITSHDACICWPAVLRS